MPIKYKISIEKAYTSRVVQKVRHDSGTLIVTSFCQLKENNYFHCIKTDFLLNYLVQGFLKNSKIKYSKSLQQYIEYLTVE